LTFEFNQQLIHIDADTKHGLPDPAFKALQKAFPDAVGRVPDAAVPTFTLPLVPNGTIVKIN
jgi:hypothetical protein